MSGLTTYRRWTWMLLLLPIYVFMFVKLGAPHLRLWDEGWFAVHAIEMWQNNSWWVSYFDGAPSATSSKPPLQYWLQRPFLVGIGISELSVRLPSAIAAGMTVLLLFFWSRVRWNEKQAWYVSLILLTSIGFIGYHTARGAEADALLTLFLTLQGISFYEFVQSEKKAWIWALGLAVGLAFLAKSMAAFLMLPGMAVYLLVFDRTKFMRLLKNPHLYGSMVAALAIILGYLIIRAQFQPDYLGIFVRSNVGRYTSSLGHDHGVMYYVDNMLNGRYVWWFPIAALGIILSFLPMEGKNQITRFSAVLSLTFLLVISISRSKLYWYDMPIYPWLAIAAAGALSKLESLIQGRAKALIVAAMFVFPMYRMFGHTQSNALTYNEIEFEAPEIYLRKAWDSNKSMDGVKVWADRFDGALLFYKHKFAQRDDKMEIVHELKEINAGDQVLVHHEEYKSELFRAFDVKEVDNYRGATLYELKQRQK